MKLVIFNGSPRAKKSNSRLLAEAFLKGFNLIDNADVPELYLANRKDRSESIKKYSEAEFVIFVFPLYTDCMPGIVKEFFEDLAVLNTHGKKVGFIIHSGFPEAGHSICLEKYLEKFAQRLNNEYLGTIIKGGTEGIQMMPHWMTKNTFKTFIALGSYFAKNQKFSKPLVEKLRKPLVLSPARRKMFRVMMKLGFSNFYWNSNLKKYGAYNQRFARPFSNV